MNILDTSLRILDLLRPRSAQPLRPSDTLGLAESGIEPLAEFVIRAGGDAKSQDPDRLPAKQTPGTEESTDRWQLSAVHAEVDPGAGVNRADEDTDTECQPAGRRPTMWGPPLALANVHGSPAPRCACPAGPPRAMMHVHACASGASVPEPFCEIEPSTLQVGCLIAEGGFGKVYYATHCGRPVAVKVLRGEGSVAGRAAEEFRREVTTMASLPPHANVLRLHGACYLPPLIVTQFCSRGSLYSLLHSDVPLTWPQVTYMCLDAARGMCHLHAHRVLHRDLKSSNLLLADDGSVVVADFGLSRVLADHTLTGGMGTYQWMAPEAISHSLYSEKADVYSFAMVLWECCARQVPYNGMPGPQAAMAVMNRGLRPEIPSHCPPGLATLMRQCWAPIAEQRPSFPLVVKALESLYAELLGGQGFERNVHEMW